MLSATAHPPADFVVPMYLNNDLYKHLSATVNECLSEFISLKDNIYIKFLIFLGLMNSMNRCQMHKN